MTILRRMYWATMEKMSEKGYLDKLVNIITDYMVAAGQDTLLVRVKLDPEHNARDVDRIVLYEEDDDMMTSSIRKGVDLTVEQIRSAKGL